ncbi:NACHT, LRR and PYD domains-containing protein 1 [Anabarilius grahami]|uniref:NACHT, LRR and PYD domains-containing protein 1 n=1 Tax=Anabarilius grahami TaxID=495550 RepID=A0A3N0YD58_ANAGA|nr:NACHT, LRR and PYD domains-containing protein 1 [Anabarilius grahami]
MLAGRSVPNTSAAHTRNPPAPRVSPGMSSILVGWRGQGVTMERLKLLFLTHGEECFGTQFPRDQNARKAFPEEVKATETTPYPRGGNVWKTHMDWPEDSNAYGRSLTLYGCSITEKQCVILTSALKSNPSHLRELNLSWNELGNSGVKHLCDVLKDSSCKLERMSLQNCGITDVSSLTRSLTNSKALQFLKDLDLSFNMIGDSKQRLRDVLRDSNCDLSVDEDQSPDVSKTSPNTSDEFSIS